MIRRRFIKNAVVGATLAPLAGLGANTFPAYSGRSNNNLLNAYYFRAHTYTMIPRQVREDLLWMKI